MGWWFDAEPVAQPGQVLDGHVLRCIPPRYLCDPGGLLQRGEAILEEIRILRATADVFDAERSQVEE